MILHSVFHSKEVLLKIFCYGAVIFLILILGCKKENTIIQPPDNPPQHPIIGAWNWVESNTPWGHFTPEIIGYTRTEVFSSDSIWTLYISDTLTLQERFKLELDNSPPVQLDTIEILKIFNSFTGRWIPKKLNFSSNDTVVMTDLTLDGGTHKYGRIINHKLQTDKFNQVKKVLLMK